MIQFACTHCWTLLEVKNRKRPVRCPVCGTVIRPDEIDSDISWIFQQQGPSPYRRKWHARLWWTFGAVAVSAVILFTFVKRTPSFEFLALFAGGAAVLAAVVTLLIVGTVEDKLRPRGHPLLAAAGAAGAQGGVVGVMGVMLAYLILIHSWRWPQPLCIGLVAAGTIWGAVALPRPGGPPVETADTRGTPQTPAPFVKPQAPALPPPPPFVKPKTPPAATEFPDLVGYWAFDEGTGTTPADSVGKTEGALRGCKWVAGVRGRALQLDGVWDGFFPGAAPGLNVGKNAPFTLALWVRPDGKEGTVLSFRSHPDGLAYLRLWQEGGKAKAWVRHNGGIFIPHGVGGKEPLRIGEWHHLALVRLGEGGLEFYQDGARAESKPAGREATGAITTNARALGGEAMDEKHPDAKRFAGALDEFCVFGRALNAEEIAKLAGRGP